MSISPLSVFTRLAAGVLAAASAPPPRPTRDTPHASLSPGQKGTRPARAQAAQAHGDSRYVSKAFDVDVEA